MGSIKDVHLVVHSLAKSELPSAYSATTVNLLHALLKNIDYAPYKLRDLLEKIQRQSLSDTDLDKLDMLLRLPGLM
jgi:hypothetical protein